MNGCYTCARLELRVRIAQADLVDAKNKLHTAQRFRDDVAPQVATFEQRKTSLADADAQHADHLAECDRATTVDTAKPPARGRAPVPSETIQAIQDRTRLGHTLEQIAADLGMNRSTVQKYAAEVRGQVAGFLFTPQPWMAEALCAQIDSEIFFPEGKGASPREAKAVCSLCPVRSECLDYALEHENSAHQHGVWGGLSPKERRRLHREQRRSVA